MSEIGQIYRVEIEFEDKPNESKFRPVLIYNDKDELGLYPIVEITSVPPNDPPKFHDGYKQPINKWLESGLEKPSYVKIHKITRVEESALVSFYGNMDIEDLDKVLVKIVELHSS